VGNGKAELTPKNSRSDVGAELALKPPAASGAGAVGTFAELARGPSTLEQESARYRWLIENATISTDEFTHIGSWSKADKITLDAAIDDLMRRIPLRSPAAHPVNAPSALTDDSAAP
jgi:hypothetical protein